MSSEITVNWFAVKLALEGIPEDLSIEVVDGLIEDINLRPYLRNQRVQWDSATRRVVVSVEVEDFTRTGAESRMTEDLLEMASGVVPGYGPMRVSLVGT